MNLKLNKPIVFFDLETTGINVAKDRIVEISMLKIFPDGNEETKTMRINPGIPIPPVTSKIHGIYDNDVKDKPKFEDVARELQKFMDGCDLGGYNSNQFDVPLLVEEFLRVDIDLDIKKRHLIDAQVIFHKMEQRTLSAAYQFYCDKELVNAHSAEADTRATFEVLMAQVDRYEKLGDDIESISKYSYHNKNVDFAGRIVYNAKKQEVFNFGKHKGVPVEDVLKKEPGYYAWMMNGDFPLYTKKVLTAIKLRSAFKGDAK